MHWATSMRLSTIASQRAGPDRHGSQSRSHEGTKPRGTKPRRHEATKANGGEMSSLVLAGKTAVVTGASSGLGETFARALGRAGANVVVAARRADRLDALARDLGGTATAVTCDVGDPASVEALVAAACSKFGRVDVMVCNAGVVADA